MMGGGGSIQSMRTSLKNNRNLLKGRKKGFFKRDLSYAEIRKYYKESTDPISKEKGSNTIELREIRERLQKKRRKMAYVQAGLFTLVAILIGYGSYVFLNKTAVHYQKGELETIEVPYEIKKNAFDESMYRGKEFLKQRQYFLAIGNYQRALQYQPQSIQAEFGLAKAYAKACKYQHIFCKEATELIHQKEEKYPNQKSFTQLKKIYLTGNTE